MTKTRPRFQTESIIKTWPMVRLGDVCEINLGKTPPRGNARFWDKGRRDGYKWLSIADLANTQGGSVFDSKEYISKDAVEEVGVPVVLAGTFLLSFKLTLGRTAIAGCDLYTNEAIAAMPVKPAFQELVDLQFLNLYCRFFDWEDFAAKDEKVLGKTLNKKKLAEVPLPLPPLSVQREIVARLERELAAVEKMKKGFEALAETARAEFKAELKEVFEEISRGGAETRRLGDVCETITDGDHQPPPKTLQGVPFLVISNVATGRISFGNTRFVPRAYYEAIQENRKPRKGDVLLTVTGSYGIPVLVDTNEIFCFQRHIALLRASRLDSQFLVYALLSPESKRYFDLVATGAAQKTIGLASIRAMSIPFPSVPVQREVVARLDGAKAKAEKLEAKAREGVAVCETMRKAILKEAFDDGRASPAIGKVAGR